MIGWVVACLLLFAPNLFCLLWYTSVLSVDYCCLVVILAFSGRLLCGVLVGVSRLIGLLALIVDR